MLELIDVSKALGLLGPNRAGKSSLMRMAAAVTRPTGGRILYDGVDAVARPDALRQALGYLPQDFGVYPHLTAREFLAYLAAAKGISARAARARIDELLELVNLTEAVGRPLGGYSGGMLRRVGIAQTLLAAAAITVAGLVAPLSAVPRIVLGTQRHEYGVESLLGAYPAPGRRTFAEWLSGLAVRAPAALAPLVRFVAAADWAGVGAWAGGALFVPSPALALGTLSRTHRLFRAGYLPLWYATADGLPLLDFMGAVRVGGHPAGPPVPAVAALSALLLGAVFAAGAARRGKG